METRAVLTYHHAGRNYRETIQPGEKKETGFLTLDFTRGGPEIFEVHLIIKKEITLQEFYVTLPFSYEPGSKIFLNGWQSWSESREYNPGEKKKKLNPLADFLLGTYGDYRFASYKGCLSGWSYSYVRQGQDYVLLGSLGEEDGFVEISHFPGKCLVKVAKEAAGVTLSKGSLHLKFRLYRGREEEVFQRYFADLGFRYKETPRTTGWTSWYNYYTSISEEIILSNLVSFAKDQVPIDIFQIDDGYQKQVGDWTRIKDAFPRGMGFIAERIQQYGYKSGLWLAPFVCTGKSEIFKNHPEWVARDARGKPLKAGFNPLWGGYFYALDFYHPGFQAYLREVFTTVFDQWGFGMVKLDFLYAVTLLSRTDKTRGQMMHEAMAFLRELAGDKLILGCGVPLSAAYGFVDYCRIGSDVGLTWEDRFLKAINYKERVSTVNSLASTVGRRHLNGRVFQNDPDVFILRERNPKMTLSERKVLLYLNMLLGGLIFTSDHIGEYSKEEMALFKDALTLKDARVLKVIVTGLVFVEILNGGQNELFIFNMGDVEQRIDLPPGFSLYSSGLPQRLQGRDLVRIFRPS